MNRLLALIAFLVFGGFLLVLVIEVPSYDLIAVAIFSAALVAYDFWTSSGNSNG